MLASIPSAALHGVDGRRVCVEVHVSNGLPTFTVVGLPDAAVRESRDRVRAALLSSGFTWPQRRVTVNLAPSGVRKGGAGLDLPIAVGVLVATGDLPAAAVAGTAFVGELGLDGGLRSVPGVVSLVAALDTPHVVVPRACAVEAALIGGARVRAAGDLAELVARIRHRDWGAPVPPAAAPAPGRGEPDLADVRGQAVGRRAVEIAAAGGHHLLFVGPPGSGKTMLACRLPGILPALPAPDALRVAQVHSAAGVAVGGLPERPPLRAPHHSASQVSIVGGGSGWLRPGEISLAHAGVLFLDELGEFPASTLDQLRQPLEDGVIRLSRARETATLPARFQLVAAMNPCPCGDGSQRGCCRCSEAARERYRRRLSAPLLDRFDLAVPLARPEPGDLVAGAPGEPSAVVAARVRAARRLASARSVRCNAELSPAVLDEAAPLAPDAAELLERRLRSGTLSARGAHRVRRVARTIADLDGARALLTVGDIAEALQLRAAQSLLLAGGWR